MESKQKDKALKYLLVLVVALLVVVFLQYWFRPEPMDKTEQEYLSRIQILEARDADKANLIHSLVLERDSLLSTTKNALTTEKIEITQRHETIRNHIILLTDSQSVELLARNLTRNN